MELVCSIVVLIVCFDSQCCFQNVLIECQCQCVQYEIDSLCCCNDAVDICCINTDSLRLGQFSD